MWSLILAQAVSVPAHFPPADIAPPADPARLSLVVAQTVSETDPQRLCEREDCGALFLGRYKEARVLAGPALEPEFTARVKMGSPWNMSYRLAMIVERREGREPLVRALAGFNDRTGEACFDSRDTDPLGWRPEGPGISARGRAICVSE